MPGPLQDKNREANDVSEGLSGDDFTPERLARMREVVSRRLRGLTIILDQVDDPHNISAVLRSCEIFGIQRVYVVHPSEEFCLNREVTRGCERWLEVVVHRDIGVCLEQVRGDGFRLYAAVPNLRSRSLEALDFSRPAALILGAELRGLSEASIAAADALYHVEMHGFTQSFNVSVAAALSLFVASRRRREAVRANTDLTPGDQEDLLRSWMEAQRERRRTRHEGPARKQPPGET